MKTGGDRRVLANTSGLEPDAPYTTYRDDDLAVIINGFARPEYLPLVWEAVQYQTRRPRETWIIQNNPGLKASVPSAFFDQLRLGGFTDTRIITSDLNLGCWFRFVLAALHCRTRFVAVYDDDTVSGNAALETILASLERQAGVYVGRGVTLTHSPDGPQYWQSTDAGWSAESVHMCRVDFGGHLWVMETSWLQELCRHLPSKLVRSTRPGREIGEDMYVSYVAQQCGLDTFVTPHALPMNPSWTSLDGRHMGTHANALSNSAEIGDAQAWLDYFVEQGWQLLAYPRQS
jgi:hypothetical protein